MAYYGVTKPQGTWVHEHFHYALATTLGNLVNMFYRAKVHIRCMLTEKLSVPLFPFFKFDNQKPELHVAL